MFSRRGLPSKIFIVFLLVYKQLIYCLKLFIDIRSTENLNFDPNCPRISLQSSDTEQSMTTMVSGSWMTPKSKLNFRIWSNYCFLTKLQIICFFFNLGVKSTIFWLLVMKTMICHPMHNPHFLHEEVLNIGINIYVQGNGSLLWGNIGKTLHSGWLNRVSKYINMYSVHVRGKGASINYVSRRGGGGSQILMLLHKLMQ